MAAEVEGVDYSVEGIAELRTAVIGVRDESMKQWPESIDFTMLMTHNIALLAHLIELKGGKVDVR